MTPCSLVCDCGGKYSPHFQKGIIPFVKRDNHTMQKRGTEKYNTVKAKRATLLSRPCKQMATRNNYLTFRHLHYTRDIIKAL